MTALATKEHCPSLAGCVLWCLMSGICISTSSTESSSSSARHGLQEIPAIPHGLLPHSTLLNELHGANLLSLITSPQRRSQGIAAISGRSICLVGSIRQSKEDYRTGQKNPGSEAWSMHPDSVGDP